MSCAKLEEFIQDEKTIEELFDPEKRLVFIIGATDTGKTTLVERIAEGLSANWKVGIVDLDVGQSHIGPPTTVAWGRVGEGFHDWSEIRTEDFYFTGAVSPAGNPLPMLTGSMIVTKAALAVCEKVLVDTTGLIQEPRGRLLKQYKIDLLRPDLVLALERGKELAHILDGFAGQENPLIQRLRVPVQVREKSAAQRAQLRASLFTHYFTDDRLLRVSLSSIGLRFTGKNRYTPLELVGRIVSIRDEKNIDRALGVVEEYDEKGEMLVLRTPICRGIQVSSIVIGEVEMEP
jgi:polynucleotide 5'-hydroxyl-kinase GRC3/NOL9